MSKELINISGGELKWKTTDALRKDLGFANMGELNTFTQGNRFKPYFESYAKEWIFPQQKLAHREHKPRPRGPGLDTVERRLIAGERNGSDIYSNPHSDETGWDQRDHLAKMIWAIKNANTKSVQGLFYGKGLTDSEIHVRIWALCKHVEYQLAPTKQPKKLKLSTSRPPDTTSQPAEGSTTQPSESTASPVTRPGEGFYNVPSANTATPTTQPPANDGPVIDLTLDEDEPIAVTVEVVRSFQEEIQFKLEADDPAQPPMLEEGDDEHFGSSRTITPAQRLKIENQSIEFDISQDFWKAWLIDRVIKSGDNPTVLRSNLQFAQTLNLMADADSQRWLNHVTEDLEQDMIQYEPYTEEYENQFNEQQRWLDSIDYQRQDLEAACRVMQIEWKGDDTIYRMPGMALSAQFTYWQVVGIKAVLDFMGDKNSRGCILSDVVGLGKTFILVGFMLWLRQERLRKPENKNPHTPFLVILPNHLITQWIATIQQIAPSMFTIWKYHGDDRRSDDMSKVKKVQGRLHRNHHLFNKKAPPYETIIITSYTTFSSRHGPSAQRKWLIDSKRFSKTMADNYENQLHPDWDGSLRGCFQFVLLDEGHLVKSSNTSIHTSITWLYASKYILATASPMPNGIDDFKGYMPFLEHPSAEIWWSEKSLAEMGFKEDENPYDLTDDHPAVKLQMTSTAVKKWIFAARVDSITKGVRLNKIWKRIMLRRTNSSKIPFMTGRTIGDNLPVVQAAYINCSLTPKEKAEYQAKEDKLTGKLIVGGSSSQTASKPEWSLATHRNLSLLTMWLGLPALDAKYNLKATNMKSTLQDKNFFLEWFRDKHVHPDLKSPGPLLAEICDGAPKIRALLRNLRSQVVRDREKVIVFCLLPAVTILLFAVFRLLGIEVRVMTAFQTSHERDTMIEEFNDPSNKAIVFIITYVLGATGLNLQKDCRRIHMIEVASNLGIFAQALGRLRRFGNPFAIVFLYEYYVEGTFDDRNVWRNIEKAIPQAMAELNRQIFNGAVTGGKDEGTGSVDLGNWIMVDGKLKRLDDLDLWEGQEVHVLSPHEVLREILIMAKGERVQL